MEQFYSNYLAENGRRIPIISQISINGSVKLLGIPNFHRTSGPMYNDNLLAPHDTTGCGYSGTPNQNWPLSRPRNVSTPWRGAIHARPAYISRSLENARADARLVCDYWICVRHRARMRIPSTSCNPVRNPIINHHGDDWEGTVDQ